MDINIITSHPLFISVFSILFGSVAVSAVGRHLQAKKEIQKLRLNFIEQYSEKLNKYISSSTADLMKAYGEQSEATQLASLDAFYFRVRYKVMQRSLFGDQSLQNSYDSVVLCIASVYRSINVDSGDADAHLLRRQKLQDEWDLDASEALNGIDDFPDAVKDYASTLRLCFFLLKNLRLDT